MLNLFPSLPLLALSGMIGPLSFWTAGTLLIVYDLIRMYREPGHKQRLAWYERPWLWFGGNGIFIGLVIWVDMMIASLPDLWPEVIFFLGVLGLYPLLLIRCVIGLAQNGNKREKSPRRASSTHVFIRENPLFASMRVSLLTWALLCFMVIWGACGLLFHLIPNLLFFDCLVLVLGLIVVWGIYGTFVHLRYFKRIEHLRVELAERSWLEAAALAPVFPFQGPEQLITPPLLLRPTWKAMVGWLVYGLGFAVMGTLSLSPMSLFKLFIILLFASLFYFFLLGSRCKVEATQYNLTSVSGIEKRTISWQEARLFVCYQVPGFSLRNKTTVIYELSGPGQVVQWTRVINVRSPFAVWQPVLPMDEYQRQMQAFCNLITEKTGLQLHNLNEVEPITLSVSQTQSHAITQI